MFGTASEGPSTAGVTLGRTSQYRRPTAAGRGWFPHFEQTKACVRYAAARRTRQAVSALRSVRRTRSEQLDRDFRRCTDAHAAVLRRDGCALSYARLAPPPVWTCSSCLGRRPYEVCDGRLRYGVGIRVDTHAVTQDNPGVLERHILCDNFLSHNMLGRISGTGEDRQGVERYG